MAAATMGTVVVITLERVNGKYVQHSPEFYKAFPHTPEGLAAAKQEFWGTIQSFDIFECGDPYKAVISRSQVEEAFADGVWTSQTGRYVVILAAIDRHTACTRCGESTSAPSGLCSDCREAFDY